MRRMSQYATQPKARTAIAQNDHSRRALPPSNNKSETVNIEKRTAYPPRLMYLLGKIISPRKPTRKSIVAIKNLSFQIPTTHPMSESGRKRYPQCDTGNSVRLFASLQPRWSHPSRSESWFVRTLSAMEPTKP